MFILVNKLINTPFLQIKSIFIFSTCPTKSIYLTIYSGAMVDFEIFPYFICATICLSSCCYPPLVCVLINICCGVYSATHTLRVLPNQSKIEQKSSQTPPGGQKPSGMNLHSFYNVISWHVMRQLWLCFYP